MIDTSDIVLKKISPDRELDLYFKETMGNPGFPAFEIAVAKTRKAFDELTKYEAVDIRSIKLKDISEIYLYISEGAKNGQIFVSMNIIHEDNPEGDWVYYAADDQKKLLSLAARHLKKIENKTIKAKMDEIRSEYDLVGA